MKSKLLATLLALTPCYLFASESAYKFYNDAQKAFTEGKFQQAKELLQQALAIEANDGVLSLPPKEPVYKYIERPRKPPKRVIDEDARESYSYQPNQLLKKVTYQIAQLDPLSPMARELFDAAPEALVKKTNSVAFIIGNASYESLPDIDFVKNDLDLVEHYAKRTLGFDKVVKELDVNSTGLNTLFGTEKGNFKGTIYDTVSALHQFNPDLEVLIYYTGHGAPSTDSENTGSYLVPVDLKDNQMSRINEFAYSMTDFYTSIERLDFANVTVILDTCFSGKTAGGEEWLLDTGIKATMIVEEDYSDLQSSIGATFITSSSAEQVSHKHKDSNSSLFTYYLLDGLKGGADQDGDNKVDLDELERYVGSKMAVYTSLNGLSKQTPDFNIKKNKTLAEIKL
ncbi:caspase family protein [Paraferrimonas sp. SM1919]|uniref:caspase family protein n=1 Tax=Paraferrimonas sp. SM1919 TaxID=2662263 RepID=UPI0013D4767E|nr:caspase family protein [Paraferrimonas sp. SM1919]